MHEMARSSSMPNMMRCLSSCFDVTRIWRRTERANLELKPAIRLSQEPCLGEPVSRRPGGLASSQARVSKRTEWLSRISLIAVAGRIGGIEQA